MIFAREITDDLTSLVKKIDAETGKNKSAHMGSFVVFLSNDEGMEEKLKELAKKEGLKHTILTLDNPAGPRGYNITKEAAILFTKRWSAQLWAERRIRLNTVSPGPVQTPILAEFEQSMGKDVLDTVKSLAGRHATPEDIAPVIEAVREALAYVERNKELLETEAEIERLMLTRGRVVRGPQPVS